MYNSFETFLLDLGFTWTLAKYFPYLLAIFIGWLFFRWLKKIRMNKWILFPLLALVFCLPFVTYFFFYPIYQPDLYNQGYRPKTLLNEPPKGTTLAVVVLPGCPYCMQTTEVMNRLAKQNKNLKIAYYMVSEDPSAQQTLRKQLDKRIAIRYTKDATLWMLAAEGVFPSYLLFDHKQLKRAWHNTTFGALALDELRAYK
jgi:thiol-disulfide isomerase/thioredoxin